MQGNQRLVLFAVRDPYFFVIVIMLFILLTILLISTILLSRQNQKYKENTKIIDNHNYLLKSFIDADESLIYLKDEKLCYLFVNKAFERFYNLKASDVIGKDDFSISEADETEFAQSRRNTDLAVLKENKLIVDEVRWQNRIFQTIKFPVKLLNGATGVGAFIKDITVEYRNQYIVKQAAMRNEILFKIFSHENILPEQEYDYILDTAIKLTDSAYGFLIYRNPDNNKLNVWTDRAAAGSALPENKDEMIQNLIVSEIVNQENPLIIDDNHTFSPDEPYRDISRMMTVPIVVNQEMQLLAVLCNKSYEYDNNDIYQVSLLLRGLLISIERHKHNTELNKALYKMKENESRLQLILDTTAEAILGFDADGICVFCNNSGLNLLGYNNQSEIIGQDIHKLLFHESQTEVDKDNCKLYRVIRDGEAIHIDDEVFLRKDKSKINVEYNAHPQFHNGKVTGFVITFSDIAQRKKNEEEIIYLSYHDPLTGLYNRRFFEQELKRLDVKRNLPISIIMGDINGLKLTNDVFGHIVGDEIIKKTADILRKICRADDIIARWGGDEFIMILPNTSARDAYKVVNRIRKAFTKVQMKLLKYSISLGYAAKKTEAERMDWIINRAEELMYLEKTTKIENIDYENIKNIYKHLQAENPRIKEHALNVSSYCEKIGKHLNFSEANIALLKEVAYFHDIGKVALTESEVDFRPDYRKHPTVGFRILNVSEKTMEFAKYVLSHHERWDGTGYPKGLKGEAIPLISRIVAVAEHYDNLRRNKEHLLAKDKALQTLIERAGTRFDPDIVDIFVEMVINNEIID